MYDLKIKKKIMELGNHHHSPILDHFIILQNSHLLFSCAQEKLYFLNICFKETLK